MFSGKVAFLVPLSATKPNCFSEISGRILFQAFLVSLYRQILLGHEVFHLCRARSCHGCARSCVVSQLTCIPRLRTFMDHKSFGYRVVRFWNNPADEAKGARTYLPFTRIFAKIKTRKLLQGHFHNYIGLTVESFYFLLFLYTLLCSCISYEFFFTLSNY